MITTNIHAQESKNNQSHPMQHGFILNLFGDFASHLVATGHHSHQVNIKGELTILSTNETSEYYRRLKHNVATGKTYFLFQAQNLDLPSILPGHVLKGHIIESKVGSYEPNNIIVTEATYTVKEVLLNIENPFFGQ